MLEDAAVEIRTQLLRRDLSVFDPKPAKAAAVPTFAGIFAEWRERYPALNAVSTATMENHISFTERHLLPHFGDMPEGRSGRFCPAPRQGARRLIAQGRAERFAAHLEASCPAPAHPG